MRISENKLRKIIREEVHYGMEEQEILDQIEEKINDNYPNYSVSRSGGLLIVEDEDDRTFKVAVKNALDVKPAIEVIYSKLRGGKQSENVRRKVFYLHQMEEFIRYLDGIYF